MATGQPRRLFGYAARGVPYGPDDGTLAGWASLASLPFAPDIALDAARNMQLRYPEMLSESRYASAFNPSLAECRSAVRGCPLATLDSTKASWS